MIMPVFMQEMYCVGIILKIICVIVEFIFCESDNPKKKSGVISNFPAKIPSIFPWCVCLCVRIHVFVCLFTVPPPAQVGATGVWNNKHKRDFTPLQSWKGMFLSDNSALLHPWATLFTPH